MEEYIFPDVGNLQPPDVSKVQFEIWLAEVSTSAYSLFPLTHHHQLVSAFLGCCSHSCCPHYFSSAPANKNCWLYPVRQKRMGTYTWPLLRHRERKKILNSRNRHQFRSGCAKLPHLSDPKYLSSSTIINIVSILIVSILKWVRMLQLMSSIPTQFICGFPYFKYHAQN